MSQCEVILSEFREIQRAKKNKIKTNDQKFRMHEVAHVRYLQDILFSSLFG